MLENFKIPFYTGVNQVDAMNRFFVSLFGRWSMSDLVLKRAIEIGDLNMQATSSVTIPYGDDLKLERITDVSVAIINDAGDKVYIAGLKPDITVDEISDTDVVISWDSGGFFDSPDFSSTDIKSRGIVTLSYLT